MRSKSQPAMKEQAVSDKPSVVRHISRSLEDTKGPVTKTITHVEGTIGNAEGTMGHVDADIYVEETTDESASLIPKKVTFN